jgi:excisionase family DNA binding protein
MVCEPLIDAIAAGKILGVSAKTVKRLAVNGEISALQIGNRWRFRASALDEYVRHRVALGRQPCPERSSRFQ